MNILVTGANGQLGNEMRRVAAASSDNYTFTDVAELDITDIDAVCAKVNETKRRNRELCRLHQRRQG